MLLLNDDTAQGEHWQVQAALELEPRLTLRLSSFQEGLLLASSQDHAQQPDAVLMTAPRVSAEVLRGLDVLQRAAPGLPVVILVTQFSAEDALEAVRRGAQECLPLEAAQPHLVALLLRHAVARCRLVRPASTARTGKTGPLNEEGLRNVIEHNADGMIVVDRQGEICFANPAAGQLFRRSAADLVGQPFGFPLVADAHAVIDMHLDHGAVSVALEMRVADMPWQGGRASLVSLRNVTDRQAAIAAQAEALANAERSLQREQELRAVEHIAEFPGTAFPARVASLPLLREAYPDAYDLAVKQYGLILDKAVEQRTFRIEHSLGVELRTLADLLGALKAGARDVVELHLEALHGRTRHGKPERFHAYAEEARLAVLELMGYLVSFYRLQMLSARTVLTPQFQGGGKGE